MKTLFTILGIVAVVFQSIAQTNYTKPQLKTITTTNWVKPGPYLRVVNGVTYSIAYSKLWKKFSEQEGLGVSFLDPSDGGESCHFTGGIRQIKGTTVLYDISEEWWAHETYTGNLYMTRREYAKTVIVFNLENPLARGLDFMCIKIPNYVNENGVPCVAYDCGIQATNLVPVIKEEKIKIVSTNSVAGQ